MVLPRLAAGAASVYRGRIQVGGSMREHEKGPRRVEHASIRQRRPAPEAPSPRTTVDTRDLSHGTDAQKADLAAAAARVQALAGAGDGGQGMGSSGAETHSDKMSAVQMRSTGGQRPSDGLHEAARRGVQSGGGTMPHQARIQAAFGRHTLAAVRAHVGGAAAEASAAIGANAYAMGSAVAFREAPDLHTAAHEAAHVIQQRAGVSLPGGVGRAGDRYERHADAVADIVVQGGSAEALLGGVAGTSGAAGSAVSPAIQRDEAEPRLPSLPSVTRDVDGTEVRVDDWQTGYQLAQIEQAVRDCRAILERQIAELTVGPRLLPAVQSKLETWFLLPASQAAAPAYQDRVRHIRRVFERVLAGLSSYVPVEVEPDEVYYYEDGNKDQRAIAYMVSTPWSDIHLPMMWFMRNARSRARYFLHECMHMYAACRDLAYFDEQKDSTQAEFFGLPYAQRVKNADHFVMYAVDGRL